MDHVKGGQGERGAVGLKEKSQGFCQKNSWAGGDKRDEEGKEIGQASDGFWRCTDSCPTVFHHQRGEGRRKKNRP